MKQKHLAFTIIIALVGLLLMIPAAHAKITGDHDVADQFKEAAIAAEGTVLRDKPIAVNSNFDVAGFPPTLFAEEGTVLSTYWNADEVLPLKSEILNTTSLLAGPYADTIEDTAADTISRMLNETFHHQSWAVAGIVDVDDTGPINHCILQANGTAPPLLADDITGIANAQDDKVTAEPDQRHLCFEVFADKTVYLDGAVVITSPAEKEFQHIKRRPEAVFSTLMVAMVEDEDKMVQAGEVNNGITGLLL